MKPPLITTVSIILFSTGLISLCYYHIDRPVVWFLASHHTQQISLLKIFANDIVLTLYILIVSYYAYFYYRLSTHKVSFFDRKLLTCCNAVVITYFLKNMLKIVFARYWPSTFIYNNPSLISHNVYGFNWFKNDDAYASFPSGHAAFIVSFSVSMWLLFPKLRGLWVLLSLLVLLGQIGLYYHFISDVIAGAILGALVAYSTNTYSQQTAN